MQVALKRLADVEIADDREYFLEVLGEQWALSISQLFEGGDNPHIKSLSDLRGPVGDDEEMRLRKENEIDDIEFRLKRGYDLGRFDQF